jgi:hypothetical protein
MSKEGRIEHALFIPVDVNITSNGREVLYEAIGTSERAIEDAACEIEQLTGASFQNMEERISKGNSTYFSSTNWKAPWEPKGPKPNWAAPKDPSLN